MPNTELADLDRRLDENAVAQAHLSKDVLERDAGLFATKWFDYRFLTSKEATDKFIEAFPIAYRAAFRANFDVVNAPLKKGLVDAGPYNDQRELTSVWRARQFADELGLPYDLFLAWAIEGFLRNGYKRIPRPNQLFGSKVQAHVKNHVTTQWADYCVNCRPMFSLLPVYRVEAYFGLPAQDDHYDWIVALIQARSAVSARFLLARVCFSEQILPIDRAVFEFGAPLVERARMEAEAASAPSTSANAVDTLLGCFAAPYSLNPARPPCAACEFQEACSEGANLVRKIVVSRTGVGDPVDDHRRERQRERTARCRASASARLLAGGLAA
jgi:hypothetical protein